MLKTNTSVFKVTRRLEKHSVLKFICFKLLGHCHIFTFLLIFFYISRPSLCVGYLIDHHFSIISSVNFWHLYSTHAFKGARSLPEAVRVLTLGIQTRHSWSIRLHVHLNILETCYYLTLFSCKIICFLMWTSTSLYNSRCHWKIRYL